MPAPSGVGQQMPMPQLSPQQERVNLAFIVLERVAAKDEGEGEVTKLRNSSAKIVREFLESEPGKEFDALWTPQVAKA